jgi:pimeloyl-ACP methyl ester carboxylesterase
MKALILSLIALGPFTARSDILSGVYSDMSGPRGTVVCFHGSGGSGFAWKNKPENHAFTQDLLAAGFSFVCPSSSQSTWSEVNGPTNPDIENVTLILQTLNARPPFFFIGHSNGGRFACRLAAYIEDSFKPNAVEFSHSAGNTPILKGPLYRYPSLFSYAVNDPAVLFSTVSYAMRALRSEGVLVLENDQTGLYPPSANHHAFINTSSVSIAFYNSQIQ